MPNRRTWSHTLWTAAVMFCATYLFLSGNTDTAQLLLLGAIYLDISKGDT